MSLVPLPPVLFENVTVVTHPSCSFTSMSYGVTGSERIYARTNRVVKEVMPAFSSSQAFVESGRLDTALKDLQQSASGSTNFSNSATGYFSAVDSSQLSQRYSKSLGVLRLIPSVLIATASQKKSHIVNCLFPYYKHVYPSSDYAAVNYNSLNFFTGTTVPSDSVIIYPVSYSGGIPQFYVTSGGFTIDLFVNPRYALSASNGFKAGTILHISSTMALSIVTGTQVDHNNVKTGYRLMLQLSQSADVSPSAVNLTTANNSRAYPSDLIFLSSDNVLKHNNWHHVAVRWGGTQYNQGSGSFFVDGVERGTFIVPSSSITTRFASASALYIGNYYQGLPSVDQSRFFNSVAASSDGVRQLSSLTTDPTVVTFAHPLNAEIADLKIFGTFRSEQDILTSSIQGPESLDDLLFYLPVFFTRNTRSRTVMTTVNQSTSRSTHTPVNEELMFRVNGHQVNIENYLREFVAGEHPRLFNLTSSLYTGSLIGDATADQYLSLNRQHIKRNLTILPCDNGNFTPNFTLLRSGTEDVNPISGSAHERFKTDIGGLDYRLISLKNLVSTGTLQLSISGTLEDFAVGANPSAPLNTVGTVYSVLQETRDPHSNGMTIFDISNMLYGTKILPGSVVVTEPNVSGTNHTMHFQLRDDGVGGLYRHNSLTPPATWNAVGNVFYNEGIIVIKNPALHNFGHLGYTISFVGERKIFTKKLLVIAGAGQHTSSSNSSYTDLPPSLNANEISDRFVYITNINLHDDNLNVVARANLAQPIVKRPEEKIVFRLRKDF